MGEVHPISQKAQKKHPSNSGGAWKTGSRDEYDPEKFYTRSTDDRGHSSTVRIAIPPELMTALMELVEKIPQYKSSRDFARDAIVHRLHQLTDADPNPRIEQWLREERLQSTIEYHNTQREMRERFVKNARETLLNLQRVGDRVTLAATIVDLEDYAHSLPDFWKEQLESVIRGFR